METENGQQQMLQLIPDQDYLRERADAMSQVETQMVELGSIFNKLAVMVSEHREMVQRVEDNVDDANSNISLSLNTLTDTLHNLQTNRALFFKILSVLVIFIILFVVFLA
jgi:syntaxin 5